jgi:polysaccharide chain length determinant protein (PEP-CTERM system associated)
MELRQYLAILSKRWLLILLLTVGAAAGAFVTSALMTPVYRAETTILVGGQSLENPFLDALQGAGKPAAADFVETLKSRSVLYAVAHRQGLVRTEESVELERLRMALTVQPVAGTDLIRVGVESTRPRVARDLANGVVGEFLARIQAQSSQEARSARTFVAAQIKVVNRDLVQAEQALADYRREQGVFAPEDEVKAILDRVTRLDGLKAEAEVAAAEAQARLAEVGRELGGQPETVVSATTLAANPVLHDLQAKLAGLEVELAGARATYADQHPTVLSLLAQVAEVKRRMQQEAERLVSAETRTPNPLRQNLISEVGRLQADRLALDVRRATLNRLLGGEERRLTRVPGEQLHLASLVRNAKVSEQIYVMLKQKYEELRIAETMKSGNVRVVDAAVIPSRPVRPRQSLNTALAAILGLFAGLGVAFFLEYLDTTIRNVAEAEGNLGLPVLAEIPAYPNGQARRGAERR